MSKNIIILSGSPRKNGNTDKLVAAFIEGAKTAGKNTTLFRTASLKIGGCRGCNHCFEEKGVCIQKDDMPQILDVIKKADTIVFASPVYYFGMSAQLKLAIDRTYALLSVGNPIKQAVLLMTCGDENAAVADGAVVTYKRICDYSKWADAGIIIATGLYGKDDIIGREELKTAYTLGLEI